LQLINFLEQLKRPYWIRYVLVPGLTDGESDLYELGLYLGKLQSMLKFEILPYHNLAIAKYENLKIPYRLKDVIPPDKMAIEHAMAIIKKGMNEH